MESIDRIVVLQDGETFSQIGGCKVIETSHRDPEDIEEMLLDHPAQDPKVSAYWDIAELIRENEELTEQKENLEWCVEKCRKCWQLDFGIVDELINGDAQELFENTLNEQYEENKKQEDLIVSIQDELLGEVFCDSTDKLLPEIIKLKGGIEKLKGAVFSLAEENDKLKAKKPTKKSVKRQKYIHYKNLVLKHELDDVSDFEDDDYLGAGEKPWHKDS